SQLLEMLDQRRLLAVAKAAGQPFHGLLDGFVLAGRGRLLDRGGKLGLVLGLARDRVLELLHPRPERAADLRQPLGAEEQQRQEEQKNDLAGSDVRHASMVAGFRRTTSG